MKILKIIYYLFLAFIAVIAVLLVFSTFPIAGNFKVLIVQSGSMEPTIHTGSVVAVMPVSDYKIGDMITFGETSKTKTPVTHRIYDIKVEGGNPVYITKGDANNAPDANSVPKNKVIGKVLFSVPYLGYAVDFARKPFGFALIIIVPAAIIVFDEVKKIVNEIKKNKSTKTAV